MFKDYIDVYIIIRTFNNFRHSLDPNWIDIGDGQRGRAERLSVRHRRVGCLVCW